MAVIQVNCACWPHVVITQICVRFLAFFYFFFYFLYSYCVWLIQIRVTFENLMNILMSSDFTSKHLHNNSLRANLFIKDSTGVISGLISVHTVNSKNRTSNCQCSLFSKKNQFVRNFCLSGCLGVLMYPDKWNSTVISVFYWNCSDTWRRWPLCMYCRYHTLHTYSMEQSPWEANRFSAS